MGLGGDVAAAAGGDEGGAACCLAKNEAAATPPVAGDTLVEAALKVLCAGDPWIKADYGDTAARLWRQGDISLPYREQLQFQLPDRPARHPLKLVAPQHMHKLGKGGSLQSRRALLHSLVHTESWAVDLSWDIIARFGEKERMPREFFDDFVKVAQEEGRHFSLLSARLEELGSFYGALPAHDGLWDSAAETSNDLAARLAIEHSVHEARGLDVMPTTISRFRKGGDHRTAELLESVIYPEEITHCAAGVKWFSYLCQRSASNGNAGKDYTESGAESELPASAENKERSAEVERVAIEEFHRVVRKHFRGPLKPPFNEVARREAGFGPAWYLPLASKEELHK